MPDINELRSLPFIVSAEITDLADEFQIPRDRSVACLDYGLLRFPLIIRKWQQGDFFVPFGMKQKKKLSDYFVDRKLSLPEKEKMLIIESAGTIAWIIGERIDDRFRISENTSKILQIEAKSEISGL